MPKSKETLDDLKKLYRNAVAELEKSKEYTTSRHSFTPEWVKPKRVNIYYPVGEELKRFTVVIEMVRKS